MKLELKQLAPYLPYGLNFLTNKHKIKYGQKTSLKSRGFSLDDNGNVVVEFLYQDDLIFSNEMKSCKPILRPLKDLANEITIENKSFYPLGSLLISKYPKWFVENNGSAKYTHITVDFSGRFASAFLTYQATHEIQIDSKYINNTSYLVFQKLLEWHFDVFGLIEKGLAIDINTLPQQ